MPQDFDRYKLSPERHDIYFNKILKAVFYHKAKSEDPTAIFLGGQPGSGKSGLITISGKDLKSNAVIINGDEYRGWHPDSDLILAEDEQNYASLTDPDVRVWTQRLLAHAKNNYYDIVFESTMRNHFPITDTLKEFKQAGFNVIARPMAVSAIESVTGIFMRYEGQKNSKGHGRMAPISVHNEAYSGVLDTVDEIFSRRAADKIEIYSRSLEKIGEVLPEFDGVVPSLLIKEERDKPLSFTMAISIVQNWKDVSGSMSNRKAADIEYKNARGSWEFVKSEIYGKMQADFTQKAIIGNEISKVDAMIFSDFQTLGAKFPSSAVSKTFDPEP